MSKGPPFSIRVDIEGDPFGFAKGGHVGKTDVKAPGAPEADFAAAMVASYRKRAAARIAEMTEKLVLNSMFPPLKVHPAPIIDFDVSSAYPRQVARPIPILFPGSEIIMNRTTAESFIPRLEVPAPVPTIEGDTDLPEAAIEEIESASVQVLRKILVDRRAELSQGHATKSYTLGEIEDLKEQLDSEYRNLESAERHILAAETSIAEVLADIEKLGGRPEPADPETKKIDEIIAAVKRNSYGTGGFEESGLRNDLIDTLGE